MKSLFLWGVLVFFSVLGLSAESNTTLPVEPKVESNSTSLKENNVTKNNATKNKSSAVSSKVEEALKKQMEREKKYAREQVFYQGSDYDLSSLEVDKSSLENIPAIEPDYDFNMDDVYD